MGLNKKSYRGLLVDLLIEHYHGSSIFHVFSGPYFLAVGLNMDQKKLRIWRISTQCLYRMKTENLWFSDDSTVYKKGT